MGKRAQAAGVPQVFDGATGRVVPYASSQRTPLKTVRHAARELSRVYVAVKRGEIPSDEGSRRAYILQVLAKVLETAELEARLDRLEREDAAALPGSVEMVRE